MFVHSAQKLFHSTHTCLTYAIPWKPVETHPGLTVNALRGVGFSLLCCTLLRISAISSRALLLPGCAAKDVLFHSHKGVTLLKAEQSRSR